MEIRENDFSTSTKRNVHSGTFRLSSNKSWGNLGRVRVKICEEFVQLIVGFRDLRIGISICPKTEVLEKE